MSTPIQNNTEGLQEILQMVQELDTGGIDTSDATATADDMADGKTAYVNGKKISGRLPEYTAEYGAMRLPIQTNMNFSTPTDSDPYFSSTAEVDTSYIIRAGAKMRAEISAASLGDATTEDVAKGKTFTSANGLKLTGTFEGGGLPDGISAIDTGTFTPTSDVTNQITINHNLGVVPNFYFAFVEGGIADISAHAKEYVQSFGIKLPVGTNTFADVHINITSSGSLTQASQSYGDAVYKMYFKDTSFRLALCGGTLKTGVTYRWVCGVME